MKATVYDRRFSFCDRGRQEGREATKWLPFPFDPVNLSAVQNGVEVLLWICDGLEIIGVHKSFDDRL